MLASTQNRDNYSWDAKSAAVTLLLTAPQMLETDLQSLKGVQIEIYFHFTQGEKFCQFAYSNDFFSIHIFFLSQIIMYVSKYMYVWHFYL